MADEETGKRASPRETRVLPETAALDAAISADEVLIGTGDTGEDIQILAPVGHLPPPEAASPVASFALPLSGMPYKNAGAADEVRYADIYVPCPCCQVLFLGESEIAEDCPVCARYAMQHRVPKHVYEEMIFDHIRAQVQRDLVIPNAPTLPPLPERFPQVGMTKTLREALKEAREDATSHRRRPPMRLVNETTDPHYRLYCHVRMRTDGIFFFRRAVTQYALYTQPKHYEGTAQPTPLSDKRLCQVDVYDDLVELEDRIHNRRYPTLLYGKIPLHGWRVIYAFTS